MEIPANENSFSDKKFFRYIGVCGYKQAGYKAATSQLFQFFPSGSSDVISVSLDHLSAAFSSASIAF